MWHTHIVQTVYNVKIMRPGKEHKFKNNTKAQHTKKSSTPVAGSSWVTATLLARWETQQNNSLPRADQHILYKRFASSCF